MQEYNNNIIQNSANIQHLVEIIDNYLSDTFPEYFSNHPTHPCLPLRHSKIIHDTLWGTSQYTFVELAILDSPILQRLRGINQTGLANYVYPSANHSRLEHSLGVLTISSKIFDAISKKSMDNLKNIATALSIDNERYDEWIKQIQQELRCT